LELLGGLCAYVFERVFNEQVKLAEWARSFGVHPEVRMMRGHHQEAQELAARARAIAVEQKDARQEARIGLTEARLHLFAGRMRAAPRSR
jgi:hypothetical protein